MALTGRFLIGCLTSVPPVWLALGGLASAQSITAAPDGIGTVVNREGDRYTITGGSLSSDQRNLFQSFSRFGISANEVATFFSDPQVQNILGRVTGGDASIIDGLLQVRGSNANLYLMNPAGILFGPNARLDLPASFFATTATGIGFDNGWFSAIGGNDYASLVGSPNAFAFTGSQPGAIANLGNLSVSDGQSLTLMGGTVLNAGTLTAPGGQITIAAVPGENLVRVSQQGMVLSLELPAQGGSEPNPLPFSPLSLPELLTGGAVADAANVAVQPDGTVRLAGSPVAMPTEAGTAIASGTLDASRTQTATPNSTGGTVRVLGHQVGLVEANINAAGTSGGGTILVGGDYQGRNTLPTAQATYVDANSFLNADAQASGNGGQVVVWSDQATRTYGAISARGGAIAGNGGLVETSSGGFLDAPVAPDVSAPVGTGGTWLIDPHNITIGNTNSGNNPVPAGPPFTATQDSSFLPSDTLRTALTGGATVVVSTGTTGTTENGDITLVEGFDFDGIGSGTLRLEAARNININAEIFDKNTASPDSLNLFLLADSDNNQDGSLNFSLSGRLNTGGGDIVGVGRSTGFTGIQILGNIQSDARNITLTGSGTTQGITISPTNLTLTGGGTVTLNGSGGSSGIQFITSNLNFGSSTVNLTADEIGFTGAGTVQGSGSLLIQPTTPDLGITIGGTATTAGLDLSTDEFSRFNSFREVTVGRADGTGAIAITGNITAVDPLLLRSNSTINTTGGSITATGDASVTLQANQGITTGSISTEGQAIALRNINGSIDTSGGTLQTNLGSGAAGGVSLDAANGSIRTGAINTSSASGAGGAIAFNASGPITTGNLAFGSTNGSASGALSFNTADLVDLSGAAIADNGARINVGDTTPPSNILLPTGIFRTNGGSFTISRNSSLTLTGSVNTGGGRFSLGTTSGNLTLNGFVNTGGGDFSLSSAGTLSLSDSIFTSGGDITLRGTTVNTGLLDASNSVGAGGSIDVTATRGAIATGDLNSSGFSGGSVQVNAVTAISAGVINSSGSSGNGGSVSLDPSGNVTVTSINAQGGNTGSGGQVNVVAGRLFRATGSFSDRNGLNTSISTTGGQGGNSITIQHGGNGNPVFTVGNAATNGTAGAISSGSSTISPVRSFRGTFRQGNVGIITNAPPIPVPSPAPTPVPSPSPQLSLQLPPRLCPPDCLSGLPDNPLSETGVLTIEDAQRILRRIQQQANITPAILYVNFVPSQLPLEQDFQRREATSTQAIAGYTGRTTSVASLTIPTEPQASDELELLLVTPTGEPVRRHLTGVTRAQVIPIVERLFQEITDRTKLRTTSYLPYSQQLYQWIIAPVEGDLQERQVQNIAFVMDSGLRSLPVAALNDGHRFLIEQYSVGLMPSLNLVDTRYTDIRDRPVLAMGASQFEVLPDLPAVPTELQFITEDASGGKTFLNNTFTVANLQQQQQQDPFSIIHLATHGQFDNKDKSYIQFWDQRLRLDQLRQLQLNNPPVELLVLSACRTALGDEQAELGFAGFALQAGVKTALASLWYVSDDGTLGLMTEFYRQLRSSTTKAEALRRTQLAMLQGTIRIENGQLLLPDGALPLPSELRSSRNATLSHPYYWSAFTLVGSPW